MAGIGRVGRGGQGCGRLGRGVAGIGKVGRDGQECGRVGRGWSNKGLVHQSENFVTVTNTGEKQF